MMLSQSAIELLGDHCDLAERVQAIPPSARVRGMYFRSVENELSRRQLIELYRQLFPSEQRDVFSWYPLSDYLVRLATAGALVATPPRVHQGMYELSRANATAFAGTVLGRTLIRLLSRDPVRLTEQGLAARRQTFNYGSWSLARRSPREIEMIYRSEYLWLESAVAGAAHGTFEACGLSPELETQLEDRFNGSTIVRW